MPNLRIEILISFDGTSLCVIEAGQVIYKEQSVYMNTPGRINFTCEFEWLVCADDNHNDGANNEGIAAGVVGGSWCTTIMSGKTKGLGYWIEISVMLEGIKQYI